MRQNVALGWENFRFFPGTFSIVFIEKSTAASGFLIATGKKESVTVPRDIALFREDDIRVLTENAMLRPGIVRVEKKIARVPVLIVTTEELIAHDLKLIV